MLAAPTLGQDFVITITNPGGVLTADANPFGPAGQNDSIEVRNNTTTPAISLRATKYPSPGRPTGTFPPNSGSGWGFALDGCDTIHVQAQDDSGAELCLVEPSCECVIPDYIPAVSTWGLAIIALLILATATVVIRRQRRAAH